MGCLSEIFAAPVVGPGLRGDCVLPPERRRAGTLPPVAFDFDPDQPRDAHGRWGGGATAAARPTVLDAKRDDAADAAFIAASNRWVDSLPPGQQAVIGDYSGSNYYRYNTPLRPADTSPEAVAGNKNREFYPDDAGRIALLRQTLATAPVAPAPVTSYRGVRSRFPDKLPKLEEAFRAALATGQPVVLPGFSSASLDPRTAADWSPHVGGFVLEMKSRRGVYIDRAAVLGGEREVLHNHGAAFRVTGVRPVEYRSESGAPPVTRTTYTLEEVEPTPPAAGPLFPAVAGYARGRALAAVVAAAPCRTTAAFARMKEATAAFKRWPQENPDREEFGPAHCAEYRKVEAAEKEFQAARDGDRQSFLAAVPPVQPVAWAPDTAGCRPHGRNKQQFEAALAFVTKLVPASTGADPRIVVADGPDGPAYSPPAGGDVGYIESPAKTGPVTFAHELGHHLEFTIPGAQKLCQDFLAHRAAGEEPADLTAMGLTQDSGARGVKDNFDKLFGTTQCYYAGRQYPDGGTEILSMGLEALYASPVHFAQTDPEFFAFMIGVLSGDLAGKGNDHAR